jgi:hypothetical protein
MEGIWRPWFEMPGSRFSNRRCSAVRPSAMTRYSLLNMEFVCYAAIYPGFSSHSGASHCNRPRLYDSVTYATGYTELCVGSVIGHCTSENPRITGTSRHFAQLRWTRIRL